jgi:hypothetical protein
LHTVFLPVAPAPDFDPGRNFDQAFLCRRQMDLPRHQEAGERLHVPAAKPSPRTEWRAYPPGIPSLIVGSFLGLRL